MEKKSNGVTTETPGESKFKRKFLFLRTFVFVYKMSERQIAVFVCDEKKLPGTSNKDMIVNIYYFNYRALHAHLLFHFYNTKNKIRGFIIFFLDFEKSEFLRYTFFNSYHP